MAAVHAALPRVTKMTVILCKTQTLLGQYDELQGNGERCHPELPNTGLDNKRHALKKVKRLCHLFKVHFYVGLIDV